jgi:hypothetical protein
MNRSSSFRSIAKYHECCHNIVLKGLHFNFSYRRYSRDKEESSNEAHLHNGNGNKNSTGSAADFVVDLERADEVEVAPRRKKRSGVMKSELTSKNDVEVLLRRNQRRGARRSEPSATKDAAGKCAQVLIGAHASEKEVGGGDAQATDHCRMRQFEGRIKQWWWWWI